MKRTPVANLAALLACAVLGASAAHAQQFTMKLSSPTINDVSHEWMKAFKAGVEGRTGGRVKVEMYPANQLGQIPRTVEGVVLGTIEFTAPAVGFFIGLEPRFQVLDAPGLFDSMEHGNRVFEDPEIRKRLATFGAGKGVEPLITFVHGPMGLVSHKAIRGLDDFKGQKIRVPGGAPVHVEPFRKLGVAPISMPLGEVLPAMQNRAVDGLIASTSVFNAFKYYDVAKAQTMLPGTFLVAAGLVNRKFMKSLGEHEAVVRDEAQKAQRLFSTWGVEDAARVNKAWEERGGAVINFPAAESTKYLDQVRQAVAPILASSAQSKEDYEALVAAAKRHRR